MRRSRSSVWNAALGLGLAFSGLLSCGEEDPPEDICPIPGWTCQEEGIVAHVAPDIREPGLEAFFHAVVDLGREGRALEDEAERAMRTLVELYGIEPESSRPETWVPAIRTAVEADLAEHLAGPLTVQLRPPRCATERDAARSVWLSCMGAAANDFDVGLACMGTCRVEGPGACGIDAVLSCEGVSTTCAGTCEGDCRLDVASACEGSCVGTCEGDCDRVTPGGSCIGGCDGTCLGLCEQPAGGSCAGACEGTCRWASPEGCPSDGLSMCTDLVGNSSCAGPCQGRLSEPGGRPTCALAASTRAVLSTTCEPTRLWVSPDLEPSLTPEEAGQFRARLATVLQAFRTLATLGHASEGRGASVLDQAVALIVGAEVGVRAEIEEMLGADDDDLDLFQVILLGCALAELSSVATVMGGTQANALLARNAYVELAEVFGVVEVEQP